MNILKIPLPNQNLDFSASLTGITYLRKTHYSSRHIGKGAKLITTRGEIDSIGKDCTSHLFYDKQKQLTKKKPAQPLHCTGGEEKVDAAKIAEKQYSLKKSLIKHRINNYMNAAKKGTPLYFITITFPPVVSDNMGYKFLNQWLTRCRQLKLIHNYLWVAERQKIGTIHYHMAVPHYINVHQSNKVMQVILSNSARAQEINYTTHQAKRYNGIDLAKNRTTRQVINFSTKHNKKSLTNYLTKYITKNETKFNRLVWHNSRDFGIVIIKVTATRKEIEALDLYTYLNFNNPFISEHSIFYRWQTNPPPPLTEYLRNLNSILLSTDLSHGGAQKILQN